MRRMPVRDNYRSILNPEDEVLGRAEQHVDVGEAKGSWQEDLTLAKALGTDDLVWHRVR